MVSMTARCIVENRGMEQDHLLVIFWWSQTHSGLLKPPHGGIENAF
jgi:hypothetical protein